MMNQKEQWLKDSYKWMLKEFCKRNNVNAEVKPKPDNLHCTHKARGLIIDFGKADNTIFQYDKDEMKHKSTERTLANLYDAVNWLCYITDD